MKEYFSHDYNARNDPRLVNVFMKHKLQGIGLYWCIIEMLYECNGYLMLSECERIAFELRIEIELILSIINDFDLFKKDKKRFWSDSVLNRIAIRETKSNKAKYSASIRWNNANALQTECNSNAIKLNKSKIKENNNIDNWKTNFEIYKEELRMEYAKLISDKEFILQQEKYNPGVDIVLSIQKACVNYWSTEAGWKHKKAKKTSKIDWKSTLTNAIAMNKVYKPKDQSKEEKRVYTGSFIKRDKKEVDLKQIILDHATKNLPADGN